jgi:acetyltransferase-like isoleucine patch superfamily enzyme
LIQIAGRGSSLSIGKKFIACSESRQNSLGVIQPVIIKTTGNNAKVVIGDDVGMSGCTISAATSITIGDHVLIGSGCLITDNDAHPVDPDARRAGVAGAAAPVVIEDDVFIGARAIILKGVTIGRGSVIGAGSIVTKSVPAFSVAAGNPARVVGSSRRLATQTESGAANSGMQQ